MEIMREQLVPSDNLADFYKQKITVGMTNIYLDWLELDDNKKLILRINLLLDKIFHQIKSRLVKFELNDLVNEYIEFDKQITNLHPFKYTYAQDTETGGKIKKVILTKHYKLYHALMIEKEEFLWKCLDALGLTGEVQVKTRRLR